MPPKTECETLKNPRYKAKRRSSVAWIVVLFIAFLLFIFFLILYGALRSGKQTPVSVDPAAGEETSAPRGSGRETVLPPETDPETSGPENTVQTTAPAPPATYPPETTQRPETTQKPVTTQPPPPSSDPGTSPVILRETPDAGEEYISRITFLGDSTTYGMLFYQVLPGGKESPQVWVPKSGTLALFRASYDKVLCRDDNVEYLIPDAVAAKKPDILVITLGVNGVSSMDETSFKSAYGKLIESIRAACPETKIVLQSIFPVSTTYERLDAINNTNITAANGWIVALAERYSLRYLDTRSVLSDGSGNLPLTLQNGDGMHLNAQGFEKILGYIRTHALPS